MDRFKMTLLLSLLLFYPLPHLKGDCYSLAEALALTLLHNPDLNTFDYEIRAKEAKILQASFRPNPSIDMLTENISAPIFVQTTLMLSQLIELGGKRPARVQVARTERERVALDYEVMKRELYVKTALLFIDVLVAQKKVAFLEENVRNLQSFSQAVTQRLELGKGSIVEESHYIVLLNMARIELNRALNELKNSKTNLAAQWGSCVRGDYSILGDLDSTPQVVCFDKMGEWIQEHPQIVRSHYEGNLRSAKVALERSHSYPDVSLNSGPRYLEEAKKWVWVVGFSAPLPFTDRNQGRIWESSEYLCKLEKEQESLWVTLLTELNTSYSTLETVYEEIQILKNSILPAAQKSYEFSHKGYQLARYNYLELIETERAYRMTKIRYLEALGDYHKSLALLQGLTGSRAITGKCDQ